ncbi:MAG: radical SAM protein [Candidatus Nanoarchaeia archaeon]
MNQIVYKTKVFTQKKLNIPKQKILTRMILTAPKMSKRNMLRLLDFILFIDSKRKLSHDHKVAIVALRRMVENDHPSIVIVKKLYDYLSPSARYKLVENFFVNGILINRNIKEEFFSSYGFNPPFFFVMSPTMKCNLRCEGCYAGKYEKEELSYELMDRLMAEAKDMGIYFVTISGGEPFMRKDDLLRLFKKHNDMYFQVYTNGTLITDEVAKKLSELGNVALALSVEGLENETDLRRGKGVFARVTKAMDTLREHGVLFGFSAVPTRHNADVLCSEEFVDFVIKKGCFFGWFFQYIPIGKDPNVNLMMTPEQRNNFRVKLKKLRKDKPIFIADFWNDGPYTNGCMAGGRMYFHITSNGDVEPCVFVHFAVDNVKNKSLKEILNSDFFKEIRANQPCSHNHLRPCMVIDNPKIMREVCLKYGAYPTHPGSESIIKDKKIVKFLDDYSNKFKSIVDPIWDEKRY